MRVEDRTQLEMVQGQKGWVYLQDSGVRRNRLCCHWFSGCV